MAFLYIVGIHLTIVLHSLEGEGFGSVGFSVHLIPNVFLVFEDIQYASSRPDTYIAMLRYLFLVEFMDDLAEAFACGVVTVDSSDHLGFFLVDDQLVLNKVVAVESVLEEVFTSFHSVLFTHANVLGY